MTEQSLELAEPRRSATLWSGILATAMIVGLLPLSMALMMILPEALTGRSAVAGPDDGSAIAVYFGVIGSIASLVLLALVAAASRTRIATWLRWLLWSSWSTGLLCSLALFVAAHQAG